MDDAYLAHDAPAPKMQESILQRYKFPLKHRWHIELRTRAGHELVQDPGEAMQLGKVRGSELTQTAFAAGTQPDPYEPAIAGIGNPAHKAGHLRTVHQLDGAVMAQQKVTRKVTDGRRLVAGMTFDRDYELVLGVSQARGAGVVFAPPLETPQTCTKCQQMLEIVARQLRHAILRS